MAKLNVKNAGGKSVGIPYHGGVEVVQPGKSANVEIREGWLDDARKAQLERMGVTIGKAAGRPEKADPAPAPEPKTGVGGGDD
ncbi:MAG: hypothetical protein AAGK66_06090 [Pseudomonadota bacterium]